tara:strand:- start:29 stop:550 length:522 start_codon:yes stop_codon:yes gene_type:complete
MKGNKFSAVIFDVDGTIADTERDVHRLAFNSAFKKFNINWNWDVELYGELLNITGGKERIRYYIEKYAPDKLKTRELEAWITNVHINKTKYFLSLLNHGLIQPRPGVIRLIKELRSAKIDIAIASTTTLNNITTLLKSTLGKDSLSWFNVIAAGDIVPKKNLLQIFIYGRLTI